MKPENKILKQKVKLVHEIEEALLLADVSLPEVRQLRDLIVEHVKLTRRYISTTGKGTGKTHEQVAIQLDAIEAKLNEVIEKPKDSWLSI